MICVYDIGNENFSRNGDAILQPTKCRIRMVAGGQYDLSMDHPMDPSGKWGHLVPEAIIKAPIPEEKIDSAVSGMDVDVYVTNATTTMYSGPSAPTRITYSEWNWQTEYHVGDKVTCTGASHRNYKCTSFDTTSQQVMVPPYNNPGWWKAIADMTSGSPVVGTFPAGTQVYLIDNAAATGWYEVMTTYGLTGYMQSANLTYSHHITPEEQEPKIINEQLFRIKSVAEDTKTHSVSVTAEHVSYDLKGVLVAGVDIGQQVPAMALALIQVGFMMSYRGMIATNLTETTDGTYTGKINGKNGVYALLDPDKGVVAQFKAACRRDNWDYYVMRKTSTVSAFRLRYRKNIEGVNWNRKSDQLVTRVVPVAKDAQGNDFFLDPTKWVDSSLISNYPVIRMEWLQVQGQVGKDDGTGEGTNWTETTLRTEMAAKAQARYDTDKADQIVNDITIDFEQLGDTEEYRALKGLEKVVLYDHLIATDERIGLNAEVEVCEIEFDAIREKITALKLTNVSLLTSRSVSGYNVVNKSITGDKLTDDVTRDIQEEAVLESNSYTDGRITNLRSWISNNFEPKQSNQ